MTTVVVHLFLFQIQFYVLFAQKLTSNNYYLQHQTTYSPSIIYENYSESSYCSFFNNRAPSTQINLKNCTWYKEYSCCLQREIEAIFSKVKPLIGSSELCQKYLNKLMCYICSPNQYKFYGKERLTVCVEYCNDMYNACSEAILKGSKINEIYSNGIEFCKSRRFNVDHMSKDKCFYYHVQVYSFENRVKTSFKCIIFTLICVYFIINYHHYS